MRARLTIFAAVLLLVGSGLAPAFLNPSNGLPVSLVCDGIHEGQGIAVATVVTGNGGVGTAVTDGEIIRKSRRIQVYVAGGKMQVRPEPGMLPKMVRKSNKGWFPVYDLLFGKEEMTGRFALNAMNKPKVKINRRTGVIELKGLSYFYGVCRKAAAPPPTIQF